MEEKLDWDLSSEQGQIVILNTMVREILLRMYHLSQILKDVRVISQLFKYLQVLLFRK